MLYTMEVVKSIRDEHWVLSVYGTTVRMRVLVGIGGMPRPCGWYTSCSATENSPDMDLASGIKASHLEYW